MQKNVKTLQLKKVEIPTPFESRNTSDNTYVRWGVSNRYPNFLLSLYSESAIHSAIVNQKVTYIVADGLQDKKKNNISNFKINDTDSLVEFANKIVKDYLLFNCFAVEVIFNAFKQPVQFNHVPFQKLRMNKSKTKFWFSEDWTISKSTVLFDRYYPDANEDTNSKIFFFDGYFPSIYQTYSTVEYAGCVKSIVTDIEIKKFNLNNISNSFSPATLITFFQGANVSNDIKEEISDEISEKFTGTEGEKFIIDFQTKDGKGAEIKNLSVGDWHDAYNAVTDRNIEDILIGHQVINPALFGIKTAGQLGNSQELEISYQIFKNNYVSVKRKELMSAFVEMFSEYDEINEIEFVDKALFENDLSDDLKKQIYTINELRKIAGLKEIEGGDRLLNDVSRDSEFKEKKNYKILSEEDFDKIKHLGTNADEFEVEEMTFEERERFDKKEDIAKYFIDNDIKNLTIEEIADLLNDNDIDATTKDVIKVIKELKETNIISVNDNGNSRISIIPNPEPKLPDSGGEIKVMYEYRKRNDVEGDILIPTSRGFCVKVVQSNKLYSREDIQQMSTVFGYDVFKHTGGWYKPPTGEARNYCRHVWIPVKVKKIR